MGRVDGFGKRSFGYISCSLVLLQISKPMDLTYLLKLGMVLLVSRLLGEHKLEVRGGRTYARAPHAVEPFIGRFVIC
jgi:hypothetical protein